MSVVSDPEVAVFGSLNMDEMVRVARFPATGETVIATEVARQPGGKGANQAVAAARAGARVRMSGAVGSDPAGEVLLAALQAEGIDCGGIRADRKRPTGTAYVLVDDRGENQIIISGGANAAARAIRHGASRVYLSQLECPPDQVASFLANRPAGAIGMLNAAPYLAAARSLFENVDILVVNETELAGYCGLAAAPSSREEAGALARSLLIRPGQRIVVTLGRLGSVTVDHAGTIAMAAEPVSVVDTTAAGDCFCGFLAAQLARDCEFRAALEVAHRAAGLAVGRAGAIPSIPFAGDAGMVP